MLGVLPRALASVEVAHGGLTELVLVDGLHARKARMTAESDAFVALPGGFGTLDELFEALTWSQLGLHTRPLGLLNVAGFYDSLVTDPGAPGGRRLRHPGRPGPAGGGVRRRRASSMRSARRGGA